MPSGDVRYARRTGRSVWVILAVFVVFAATALGVAYVYLPQALRVVNDPAATPQQKQELAAISRLVLAVLLLMLVAGLILAFRPGRLLFGRRTAPPARTRYTDAWSEAGRRMQTPAEEEDDEEERER